MTSASAYHVAHRLLGVREVAGGRAHPLVLFALQRVDPSVTDDATPWCSAFVGLVAFLLGLPESRSLAARSWLTVGQPVALEAAKVGCDVVVLTRGDGLQPGPEVVSGAPGHVGFFAGIEAGGSIVRVLGGNQGNGVSIASFNAHRVLGVRRLWESA